MGCSSSHAQTNVSSPETINVSLPRDNCHPVKASNVLDLGTDSKQSLSRESSEELQEDVHSQPSQPSLDPGEVQPWDESRFRLLRKLGDAHRNKGAVKLMRDRQAGKQVAVKEMPNTWLCESPEEFIRQHPNQAENPWQDIGCTRYLNSMNYKYACSLQGVYRGSKHTCVALTYASGGDLHAFAQEGLPPGPQRESALAPFVIELFSALKTLHEMQLVHHDLSLENVVLTGESKRASDLRLIDFGMASTGRTFRKCVRGKASYQAPEMHGPEDYDGFLSDAFSVGVVIYALLLKDYPWTATKPGSCKNFQFVMKNGFCSYLARRMVQGTTSSIASCCSPGFAQLLEGLLSLDPNRRLTLGEKDLGDRRSVWDEPWTRQWTHSTGEV